MNFFLLVLAVLTDEKRELMISTVVQNHLFLPFKPIKGELGRLGDEKLTKVFDSVVMSMINNAQTKRRVLIIKSKLKESGIESFNIDKSFSKWRQLDIIKTYDPEKYKELRKENIKTVGENFASIMNSKIQSANSKSEVVLIQEQLDQKEIATTTTSTLVDLLKTQAKTLGFELKLPPIRNNEQIERFKEQLKIVGEMSLKDARRNLKAIRDLAALVKGKSPQKELDIKLSENNYEFLKKAAENEIKSFQTILKSQIRKAKGSRLKMESLMNVLIRNEAFYSKYEEMKSNPLKDANRETILNSKNLDAIQSYNKFQKIADLHIPLPKPQQKFKNWLKGTHTKIQQFAKKPNKLEMPHFKKLIETSVLGSKKAGKPK